MYLQSYHFTKLLYTVFSGSGIFLLPGKDGRELDHHRRQARRQLRLRHDPQLLHERHCLQVRMGLDKTPDSFRALVYNIMSTIL
jgi:hypothetical protein